MKKSLIVVVMAMLAFGGSAMAQKNIKLGHINSNDLMQMPWIIEKNVCRTINVYNCNLGIFDPDSDLCRAFAANYGLESMSFCPEQFLDILQNSPEQLDTLNDCGGLPIYVIRWNDDGPVVGVRYELSEEEGDKPFYKR